MKFKKFFALAIAVIMLCTAVVSVNAANYDSDYDFITDLNTNANAAKVNYSLLYNSYANCIRATNAIIYYSNVHVSQRNFPGYISLEVVMNGGKWTAETAEFLHTTSNNYEFYSDFYIPAGYVLTSASAYYSTNDDNKVSDGYYVNYNYSWVTISNNLVVTP